MWKESLSSSPRGGSVSFFLILTIFLSVSFPCLSHCVIYDINLNITRIGSWKVYKSGMFIITFHTFFLLCRQIFTRSFTNYKYSNIMNQFPQYTCMYGQVYLYTCYVRGGQELAGIPLQVTLSNFVRTRKLNPERFHLRFLSYRLIKVIQVMVREKYTNNLKEYCTLYSAWNFEAY